MTRRLLAWVPRLARCAVPWVLLVGASGAPRTYDVVILNGRVVDPESRLDAVRNVGIEGGTVRAITSERLAGRVTIDARGLVVAPGFIDLHVHDMNLEHHRAQAMDGVTTALDLEIGTSDVDRWYEERAGAVAVQREDGLAATSASDRRC